LVLGNELSSDEARRSILITAGLARANDFTWEATATGLVNLYRRSRQR
jgi:glycosyltransferase involved in cell wall biosynthesis